MIPASLPLRTTSSSPLAAAEESIQDVPQTVNVVTSAQIEKLNLRTFTEIASVVPGLTLTPGGSCGRPMRPCAACRSVRSRSGDDPTVEFYIDDGPISSNLIFQSLFDVGQFEVQRGPQGTLRGRASPSGSIVFNTRSPDIDELGAVANATVTDLSSYKVDGAINVSGHQRRTRGACGGRPGGKPGRPVFAPSSADALQFNPDHFGRRRRFAPACYSSPRNFSPPMSCTSASIRAAAATSRSSHSAWSPAQRARPLR